MARPSKRGTWVRTWEGGRVWRAADGSEVYVIRRQVSGRRYEVSTGATTRRAALKQLERFESDPERYRPAGDPDTVPLYLDNDLAEALLAWSKNERSNTASWIAKQRNMLAWWMTKLHRVNLRRATLRDHILPALEKAPARRQRIQVVKSLFSYLRKVRHLIDYAQDPTLDLPVPQVEPAQWTKSKVIPRDHIDLVLEHLRAEEEKQRAKRAAKVVQLAPAKEPRDGPWADALTVQAGTGWHTTEVVRFAASGSIEPLPKLISQEGVAGVLVCPMHKSGEPLRTRASTAAVEAAKRLLQHGAFSREWYDRTVRDACKTVKRPDGKVGIPLFTPGRLRHSVATWAIDSGADPAVVAAFLGHKSPRTTRRFYATHASVAKVPTPV